MHRPTATEKHTCLLQGDRLDWCRRHLVLKGSGLLLAPLSQPIELLACLVQPRHPASRLSGQPLASLLCCSPRTQWHRILGCISRTGVAATARLLPVATAIASGAAATALSGCLLTGLCSLYCLFHVCRLVCRLCSCMHSLQPYCVEMHG